MSTRLEREERKRHGFVIGKRTVYRDYWYENESPDPGKGVAVVLDSDLSALILTDAEVRAAVLKARLHQ